MEKPKITQIKYKKTSCYFCNEWFDNGNFKVNILILVFYQFERKN